MPRFLPEPSLDHGTPAKTAVLLANLGTPSAPTTKAVRSFLKEFLSDERVVELSHIIWWPILNAFVLNTRPTKSAQKYAAIWTPDGSPLRLHSEHQAKLLRGQLGLMGHPDVNVAYAMRYGKPSIDATLQRLRQDNCVRLLVFPMYPQYAASTTASVYDVVTQCMRNWRNVPEIRFVRGFAGDPGYINALAASVRAYWTINGRPEKLVMSFHGTPQSSLTMGDPYHCECHRTARLLAETLELLPNEYLVSFQSRFGRAEWLKPYTQPTLVGLAKQGVRRVDVMCPGFVADCLETLEEVAIECKSAYVGAGGHEFHYIPCLNEGPDWIRALADLVRSHLGNWLELLPESAVELTRRCERARFLGATK